jgi:hypothetical protein
MFFLFLDGVGIGRANDPDNPFFNHPLPNLTALLGGSMLSLDAPYRSDERCSVRPLDATLGVPGLPQSGTGQTAILTGLNAAAVVGRHFGPYPYSTLRGPLARDNIFMKLLDAGVSVSYLNAFPRQYFDHIEAHPMRASAISVAWRSTPFPLNGHSELTGGTALSADCTSAGWKKLGYPDVEPISPEAAAARVLGLLEEKDFILYEYYFTDHAGHARSRAEAGRVLTLIDSFVGAFARGMDPRKHTLVVTSDHGNLEDLSTKKHTLNPVPFLCAGRGHRDLSSNLSDLTDISGAVTAYFS